MKKFGIFLFVLLVGMILGWVTGSLLGECGKTTIRCDTVMCAIPVPQDCTVVRTVTRWLPLARLWPAGDTAGTRLSSDAALAAGGGPPSVVSTSAGGMPLSCGDSCLVDMPIEQRTYKTDDYTAWVSGFEARLDSIEIYRRTDVVTLGKKRRRWGCVAGVGMGTDFNGIKPFVGVTVGYQLF